MMRTHYKAGNKTFLTQAIGEDSSISWNVELVSYDKGRLPDEIEGGITIRDCHKQVNIELWLNNKQQPEQKIDKIDTLINELIKAKKALQFAWTKREESKLWSKL